MTSGERQVDVTVWYLEMREPGWLRATPRPDERVSVVRAEVPSPELNRFLYTAVGGAWYWLDRLGWSYDQWLAYLQRPGVETWVAYVSGTPAGYFELVADAGENENENEKEGQGQKDQGEAGRVQVEYFGLLPQFIGRGIGGYLLSCAVQRAWALGARRVTVNTCSLDGPHALANYRARGFRVYEERQKVERLPAAPPGPWPGSGAI